MKRWIFAGVVCAGAALCALAAAVDPPGGAPTKPEPVGPRQPGGVFGGQLGTYMTIEGVRVEGNKVEAGTILVDTVDGKKLDKPIPLLVRTSEDPAKRFNLPLNQRCVLKGYESGEMIGTPPAVLAAAREQGQPDVSKIPTKEYRWRPYFVALIVIKPKESEIPKD